MRMGTRLAGFACALVACTAAPSEELSPRVPLGGDSPLVAAFDRAGQDFGVPAELLATLSYLETRLAIVSDPHGHGYGAKGLFGLAPEALARGARLAGVTTSAAETDALAGARAAAVLLREAAPDARTLDEFVAAMPPSLRRRVAETIARGALGRDATGHRVVIAARPELAPGFAVATQAIGYSGAEWIPASSQNYGNASRGVGDIDHVVIHTTQGGFDGTISWFQNPAAEVSAHYVVRSEDGHVVQMVDEQDVAWHDKCFNTTTIGIEHEGFVDDPERWYTEAMYAESAKVTAYIADTYGIPKEHGPIVGHGEAPDCSDHTDPGPGWNWDHYIDLVRTGGAPKFDANDVTVQAPGTLVAGDRATVVVTVTNRGNAAWDLDATRLGTTAPQDRASAFFVDGEWLSPNRATAIDTRVEPGATGTFTFDIIAPAVTEPTMFDEAFQLVEEGVTWFGPEVHVVTLVMPSKTGGDGDTMTGGCSAAPSSTLLVAFAAFGLRRRRRR